MMGVDAVRRGFIACAVLLTLGTPCGAQQSTLDDITSAVVRLKTFIDPDGRSVTNLGVSVPLDVVQGGDPRRIDIPSANRLDHLRLKSTF